MPGEPFHTSTVEEVGGVDEAAGQTAAAAIGQVQFEVEPGGDGAEVEALDVQSGQLQLAQLSAEVLHVEPHLRHRRPAQVTGRREFLDEDFERQVLVREVLQDLLTGLVEQAREWRISGQVAAQCQRVHEEADHRLKLGVTTSADRGTDDQVGRARAPAEQRLERAEADHVEAGLVGAGQRPQLTGHRRRTQRTPGRRGATAPTAWSGRSAAPAPAAPRPAAAASTSGRWRASVRSPPAAARRRSPRTAPAVRAARPGPAGRRVTGRELRAAGRRATSRRRRSGAPASPAHDRRRPAGRARPGTAVRPPGQGPAASALISERARSAAVTAPARTCGSVLRSTRSSRTEGGSTSW